MSRVGKKPVPLPQGVKVSVTGQLVKVEGPKGKLERTVHDGIIVAHKDGKLLLSRRDDSKRLKMLHGLERALANNMVLGVSGGFVKELDLIGVGYRADMTGDVLNLGLGYSHAIDFPLPRGVRGTVIKDGRDVSIRLEGVDKQLVGLVAAQIRSFRRPEPYKGKGVRYKGQVITLKAGKAGKK